MKVKLYISSLSVLLLFWSATLFSQTVTVEKVKTPIGFDISPKLIDVEPIKPGYIDRSWKEKVIPNKDGFLEEFKVDAAWTGPDPVLQDQETGSRAAATIIENFNGMLNESGVVPPDTDGDVGPNHYMQMVNLSFQIFDKSGNSLYGPALSSTLWSGFTGPWTGTNDGDPIVLYDEYADRWIATQFSLPNYPAGPFYELVAVSTTPDPTGTWYRYAYEFANMPDYPKFGIWPDGYYFTVNQFASRRLTFAGAAVCVLDRTAMISGDPNARMQFFNLGTSYGSLLPADIDGVTLPPAGTPNYLANLGTNSLRIWKADIDWVNTNNSSVQLINTLTTQSYSYSGITINQPGTSQTLDPLASRLMYRLQYRKFSNYEVMLTNHSVNANGAGQAGVRWYELRNSGNGWSIYQQGTYAPADGNDRWMGSIAMNDNGDIALGYSLSSSSTYPSVRFTGQTQANSGSGVMDITEGTIHAGNKSQTGVNRWGDYSMMSVDPSDGTTFWYTNEYSNGGWNWKTKIASFTFDSPAPGQAPVANFSGSPTTIPVGGAVAFSDLSTNLPTSWAWSFAGGNPATSTDKNPTVTYSTAGTYTVTLTVSNATGSDTKTVNGYITVNAVPANYCDSHSNSFATDYIKSVAIGSVTYTSAGSTYSDFTAKTFTLAPGSSNTIKLTPNTTNRREYWKVWIDYNGDLDFDDSGEQVYVGNNKKGVASGTITIPSGAAGQTRMRVSMKNGSTPGSCEIFANGEVEDYTVVFGTAPAAPIAQRESTGLSLELYPNPANSVLNIKVTSVSEKINIKVYSVMGSILEDFNTRDKLTALSLDKYAKGIYYIGVDDGISTTLKKFIRE